MVARSAAMPAQPCGSSPPISKMAGSDMLLPDWLVEGRRAGLGAVTSRHKACLIAKAPGSNRGGKGLRHQFWPQRFGDGGIQQDAVKTQLHGLHGIGRRA